MGGGRFFCRLTHRVLGGIGVVAFMGRQLAQPSRRCSCHSSDESRHFRYCRMHLCGLFYPLIWTKSIYFYRQLRDSDFFTRLVFRLQKFSPCSVSCGWSLRLLSRLNAIVVLCLHPRTVPHSHSDVCRRLLLQCRTSVHRFIRLNGRGFSTSLRRICPIRDRI